MRNGPTAYDLPLPFIKCTWCQYQDKVARDLERHFLEKHRSQLYRLEVSPSIRKQDVDWIRDPYSWMYDDMEYRLYKATRTAKQQSGINKEGLQKK